jgi:hypothetical protein
MKKVVGITRSPWVLPALVGFILGTLFGLFALGWGLMPVQWVDASPVQLSSTYQEDYLRAAIDSYGRNQDIAAAQLRYQGLAEKGPALLTQITNNPRIQTADDIAKFSAVTVGKVPTTTNGQTPAAGTPTNTDAGRSTIIAMLVGLCALMLVIGGVLIYLLFFRNRASRKRAAEEEPEQGFINEQIDQIDESTIEQASPFVPEPVIGQPAPNVVERALAPDTAAVAQFMTSYNLGDDLYDDTFSIDANNGEFLGECGAGISDTIGVGDPKKISAFEVWLFDKNDIQTVTKVIMSSAVYNDPTARQRLSIRGEPVLAEPGKIIRLETATLRMDVRVLDMNFGRGDTLPAASFFDRMSLELNIYQK